MVLCSLDWFYATKFLLIVIPAEAGIQRYLDKSLLYFCFHAAPPARPQAQHEKTWIPAFAGMTFIKNATRLRRHKPRGNDNFIAE
jgi:hypothetical protein